MFGQYYRISIGLDYIMKILDWIRIANISDPFNTSVQCAPVVYGYGNFAIGLDPKFFHNLHI